jgi:hypothetical protein
MRVPRDAGLGSAVCDAIDLVARDHPEADVRLIADAYDAFGREYGDVDQPPANESPKRLVARRRKKLRSR